MKRTLRVAAVQLRAHDVEAFPAVLREVEQRVEAACNDAELVVLPEGTLPAYVLGFEHYDAAAVDTAIARLSAIATRKGVTIVVGAAVRSGDRCYNAALAVDRDGSVAGRAEKIFLWHFDRRWFSPGERISPIDTRAGRIGALVCADGRMPEISRSLVDRGAELLVMPTAWVSSGRSPSVLENAIADLLAPMRARENGVPFVAANKSGVERGMVLYCGKSQILDADGEPLAIAAEHSEETIFAKIEIGEPHPHRVLLPNPARRKASASAFRLAVSAERLPSDIDARLDVLECTHVIAPDARERIAALDAVAGVATVDDAAMRDPGALVVYRRAGYRMALWNTSGDAWTERLARARAGENRVYVITIDVSNGRAFVVDPDYTIVCGTFGDYRLASCPVDLAKTEQTLVVPGTDIAEGLERVHAMTLR